MKKIISLLLSCISLVSLFTGCSSNGKAMKSEDNISVSGSNEESYTFAHNMWGSGAYPLEVVVKEAKSELSYFNCKLDVVDNQFTVDKIPTDLQSQIAKGVDGAEILAISQTLFPTINKICQDSKLPFVLYEKLPQEDDMWNLIKSNEYFVGAISAQDKEAGAKMAKKALENGGKKAIIVRAAIGDVSHDERDLGFTEAFKAGGGEVVGVTYCADPSEAVTKANDLITAHPEADCLYGAGGDFVTGAINAIKSRNNDNLNLKIYGTDITPDLAKQMLEGSIDGLDGGHWLVAALTNTLLINYLDGHPIKDNEGNAPVFTNFKIATLTPENAQAFIDMMQANESPISEEEYKNLVYRYNKDVNYQTYYDFLENIDKVFEEKLN